MTAYVSVRGRLGRDPRQFETKTGTAMATCSVGVSVEGNESEDRETIWFDVLAFRYQAEALLRHEKGDQICIAGKLKKRKWRHNTTGEDRETLQIIADSIIGVRMTLRDEAERGGQREPRAPRGQPAEQDKGPTVGQQQEIRHVSQPPLIDDGTDDIPF